MNKIEIIKKIEELQDKFVVEVEIKENILTNQKELFLNCFNKADDNKRGSYIKTWSKTIDNI